MPRRNKQQNPARYTRAVSLCQTKNRYKTERLARRAADMQELINPTIELSVYQCHQCRQWHLTSQPYQQ